MWLCEAYNVFRCFWNILINLKQKHKNLRIADVNYGDENTEISLIKRKFVVQHNKAWHTHLNTHKIPQKALNFP